MKGSELARAVSAIRKWQRHWLLRQFGENGTVLRENLELSGCIDVLLSARLRERIAFHHRSPRVTIRPRQDILRRRRESKRA